MLDLIERLFYSRAPACDWIIHRVLRPVL